MFNNAWRLERDLFVNPKMNGVTWQAVHDSYAKLLPLVGSRQDLVYLIGEMQGELGNSHTYVGGGDEDNLADAVATPLLGVDFAPTASGRYSFAKIYPGDNTREKYRSPLTEPGVDVHQGDVLLAVNGHDLHAPADPYSLFVGLDDQPVTLTVAGASGGKPHDVTVKPIKNELSVREKDGLLRFPSGELLPDLLEQISDRLELSAVTYLRGRSLANTFIIVDEAQNLERNVVKTIVTRLAYGSKIVLIGDTEQIDSPYLSERTNGLTALIEAFTGQEVFGHIRLVRCERSVVAELAAELL